MNGKKLPNDCKNGNPKNKHRDYYSRILLRISRRKVKVFLNGVILEVIINTKFNIMLLFEVFGIFIEILFLIGEYTTGRSFVKRKRKPRK